MFPGRSSPLSALAAALLLLFLAVPGARGQASAPVLVVTVHAADADRPLPGAQIVVEGVGMAGATDAAGVARIRSLATGTYTVGIRYLGFAPARATVELPATGSADLRFLLTPQPVALRPVHVVVRRSALLATGFFDRKRAGGGTFLTRDEIDRMRPRLLSDVLRRVAGVQLSPIAAGANRTRASMRGATRSCPIQYYVDGVLTAQLNADDVPPYDVEGLEVYRGAATIPPAFNRGTALCGVILIWTRRE